MLQKTRHHLHQDSIYYLIWGWLVLAATLIQYILLSQLGWNSYHWLTWPILMPIGALWTMYIGKKRADEARHSTLLDRVMGYLWGGIVIGILFSIFLSSRFGWANSYILIMLFYAIGTFVSGRILKFKPLVIGGLFSLVLILSVLVFPDLIQSFKQNLIILAISIVATYLIPGYMLRANREAYV
jgi:hypothetical protein